MRDMGITGHIHGTGHRARAVTLGVLAAGSALLAAYLAWGGMLGELHRLEHRSTVHTPDALPVLLWAALVLALLWATLLIALATATLLRRTPGSGGGDAGTARRGPHAGGMIGRVAAVLLAITALSSVSATAPAFAASHSTVSTAGTTATRSHVAGTAPSPGWTTSQDTKHPAKTADSCTGQDAPTPGWVPDKPARTDQVARDCAPLVTGKPVADDSGAVVVHRGDTLWSIAAAHLGPHADAQTIAAEWPRWYAANRHVIGDDPDLLEVGTSLQTPDHALEGSIR